MVAKNFDLTPEQMMGIGELDVTVPNYDFTLHAENQKN